MSIHAGEDVGEEELVSTTGEIISWHRQDGNLHGVSLRTKNRAACDPA